MRRPLSHSFPGLPVPLDVLDILSQIPCSNAVSLARGAGKRSPLARALAGRFRQLSLFTPTASSTSPCTTSTTNVALLDLARRPVLLVSHPGHRPRLDAPDPWPALDQLRGGQP